MSKVGRIGHLLVHVINATAAITENPLAVFEHDLLSSFGLWRLRLLPYNFLPENIFECATVRKT